MLNVGWPSAIATKAEIWRVLDLSGITNSPRESRNFIKAGFVYLNGVRVVSMSETVEVGSQFRLELRFPNSVIKGEDIFLRRIIHYKARSNQPKREYRR